MVLSAWSRRVREAWTGPKGRTRVPRCRLVVEGLETRALPSGGPGPSPVIPPPDDASASTVAATDDSTPAATDTSSATVADTGGQGNSGNGSNNSGGGSPNSGG